MLMFLAFRVPLRFLQLRTFYPNPHALGFANQRTCAGSLGT